MPRTIGSVVGGLQRRAKRTSIGSAVAHRGVPTRAELVSGAVATFRSRFDVTPAPDRPVFVLSSGWRSGSTLLQRLLVSSDEVHVWGEPWARCDIVQHLAESLAGIEPDNPKSEWLWTGEPGGEERLADRWIANLSPSADALLEAHRDLLRRFLASPDPDRRWGMKEVRLGVEHAEYLRLVFPEAAIVFVHRDPYDQWRSYAAFRDWYARWPSDPVVTPGRFGRMWADLTRGFLDRGDQAGVLTVAYDDVVSGAAVERIEAHVGVTVDRSVLGKRVGSSVPDAPPPLPSRQLVPLRRAVEPVAGRLGYRR